MSKGILVATDGSDADRGAIRVATALAERKRLPTAVVTVVEPFPLYSVGTVDAVSYTRRELGAAGEEAIRSRVAGQLAAVGPGAAAWPVTIEVGPVAFGIAEAARKLDARVVVLGLGRHSLADRLLGKETALRVMRVSPVPVLAVPEEGAGLPDTMVIAADLTDHSRSAALAAVDLLGRVNRAYLAHVFWELPPAVKGLPPLNRAEEQGNQALEQLRDLDRTLEAGSGQEVDTHLLKGDPASEILRLAERVSADLIVAGTHGAGFLERMLIGSVATRLVRGATCSVLVVPPGAGDPGP
jgi:nucleotide-binding universal stress UspA family protein